MRLMCVSERLTVCLSHRKAGRQRCGDSEMLPTLKDERMQIYEDALNTHAFSLSVVVRLCSESFVPYRNK